MRRALNALLILLPAVVMGAIVALAFAKPVKAQAAKAQNIVVLSDSVRTRLARDWDKQSKNALQHERAYCVTFRSAPFAGGRAYLVLGISAAETAHATNDRIVFYCPAGPGHASLHVHPPTTCDTETKCHFGGPEAYECFASQLDMQQLTHSVDEFGLIQCDRHAVIFFFPDSN